MLSRKKLLLGFLLLTTILWLIFYFSEYLTDRLYLNGIFQVLRVVHDYTLGFLPIPSIYIALMILFCYLGIRIRDSIKTKKIWTFILALIYSVSTLLAVFYFGWGFNYFKSNFRKQADLELVEIPGFNIDSVFKTQTLKINSLRSEISELAIYSELKYENEIRKVLEEIISKWNVSTVGRVRVRKLPKGSLLHLRTSGIYIPHAVEGHFDGGLYPVQWPFTMAHEMAHGYGFTDESVCNFIAYLVCTKMQRVEFNYSAELAYWRYLAGNVRDKELAIKTKSLLSAAVKEDLNQIRSHILAYKEWMPKSRDKIYDSYLKTHRVSAGIKSYDEMIGLVETWKYKQLGN